MSERPLSRDQLLRLQAALDGELDALQSVALERELAADADLRAQFDRMKRFRAALSGSAPREPAPERLRLAVDRLAPSAQRSSAWRFVPQALAACLALGAAFTAGAYLGLPQTADRGVELALADGFMRAEIAGDTVDVASSDRHTVKPWLATRAPLGTEAVDLADQGFVLVGGRIDIVGGGPVPTLVYRAREHLIAVTELPRDAISAGDQPARETVSGLALMRWRDAMRAYVAVSDIAPADLADFVAKFRAASGGEKP